MRLIRYVSGIAILALGSCFGMNSARAAESKPRAVVEHVVVIGVDGMGAVAFEAKNIPNLRRLMETGASTLRARGVMPTSSSPNWASMIMGAGPEQHGITSNEWETNKFEIAPIAIGSGGIFPTIFGTLREQHPNSKIVCLHDWDGFGRLTERAAFNVIERVDGTPATAARAIEVFKNEKPELMFVHFDEVDHNGHDKGWKSPEYFQAVERVDKLIGEILKAVESVGASATTLILVTADHGGKGTKHGGSTMEEIEIPWIINGPGVKHGFNITDPVNTYDTAATIASVLSLKQPNVWIAKPVLSAFDSSK